MSKSAKSELDTKRILAKLRKIIPGYDGPKRGMAQVLWKKNLPPDKFNEVVGLETKLRLIRNRESARRIRRDKKSHLQELKRQLEEKETENALLREEIERLKRNNFEVTEENLELRETIQNLSNTVSVESLYDFLDEINYQGLC